MITARGILLWIAAWLLLDVIIAACWCRWSPTARRRRRARIALRRCQAVRDRGAEMQPRYACRACEFETNYATSAQSHHDATGHHVRWTGRAATRDEIARDLTEPIPEPTIVRVASIEATATGGQP